MNKLANPISNNLKPYPMEQLGDIKKKLLKNGVKVYDFGTGDPNIPLDAKIRDALIQAVPYVSHYPSVKGSDELTAAHEHYLKSRFDVDPGQFLILPSSGSKEAIFHVALSVVGRAGGRKRIIYPDPGYPVYHSSTVFAGGLPCPVVLNEQNNFLLEPWTLPLEWQKDAAAIWINYPHNPSGVIATPDYFRAIVEWSKKFDVLILADDCYVDIYDTKIDQQLEQGKDLRPQTLLAYTNERIVAFHTLSKRSGMTGIRCGFIAGDRNFMQAHLQARANFGVAPASYVQKAGAVAWLDDEHVRARREIFSQRMEYASNELLTLGLIKSKPLAAFYFWAKIPPRFGSDDVRFCLELAEKGVITSPSSWVSESVQGYFRLAMVPEMQEMKLGFELIKEIAR
ncbi:MAG: aminotransferase class I/II-fold pyridoxal phosphate-dependent enzyme [Oligoflexales bacterium]|nr:aminotransferase class I/II-fold pyridoxal phosphate-dependent enzyme [Oligoflexales bacterium]